MTEAAQVAQQIDLPLLESIACVAVAIVLVLMVAVSPTIPERRE